jgi:hypothetical protein
MQYKNTSEKQILSALNRLEKFKIPKSIYMQESEGWKEIFAERNDLNLGNISVFLDPSKNLAHGIGVTANHNIIEAQEVDRLLKISIKNDSDFLNCIKMIKCEKVFGEKPFKITNENFLTHSNLMNAGTFHELNKNVLQNIKDKTCIRILEIGSGFGELSRQIIKYGGFDQVCYDYVDLPKNLFFAELYLGEVFGPSLVTRPKFFQKNDFDCPNSNHQLRFFDPSECEQLFNYDLIINTYSLQEMPKDVVNSYMHLIIKNLEKTNAYFFSINSPTKWDIKKYSDYNFDILKNISSYMHRPIPPSGENASVSIVNVFKARNDSFSFEKQNKDIMNIIGDLQCAGASTFIEHFMAEKISITDPHPNTKKLILEILSIKQSGSFLSGSRLAKFLYMLVYLSKIDYEFLENELSECDIDAMSDFLILKIAQKYKCQSINRREEYIRTYFKLQKKDMFFARLKNYSRKFLKRLIAILPAQRGTRH